MHNGWQFLIMILIGISLFYSGCESTILLELKGDYDSVSHRLLSAIGYLGLMLGIMGFVKAYFFAKAECETNFK